MLATTPSERGSATARSKSRAIRLADIVSSAAQPTLLRLHASITPAR